MGGGGDEEKKLSPDNHEGSSRLRVIRIQRFPKARQIEKLENSTEAEVVPLPLLRVFPNDVMHYVCIIYLFPRKYRFSRDPHVAVAAKDKLRQVKREHRREVCDVVFRRFPILVFCRFPIRYIYI